MADRPMALMFRRALGKEDEEAAVDEPEPGDLLVSGDSCSSCMEPLHFAEEIFLVNVVQAAHNRSEVEFTPLMCEEGEYVGDFQYDPLFFEFSCWENVLESLKKMVENAPPVKHEESLMACDYCGSAICEWEILCTAYIGELHVSSRMPNGKPTSTFAPNSLEPFVMCIGCLALVQEYEVDLWDDTVSQVGECSECTHARCWRWESCSCPCHTEEEES